MRRRVWWQIIMLDLHASFSTGLAPSLLPRYCDSKLPTNLNDSDMNPGATQYFTDRQGPTEMIVCLLTFRMGEFLLKTPGLESTIFQHEAQILGIDGPPISSIPSPLDAKLKAIDQALDETMAKYSLPSAGPIHALADKLRYSFSGKLRDMLLPTSQETAEGGSASPRTASSSSSSSTSATPWTSAAASPTRAFAGSSACSSPKRASSTSSGRSANAPAARSSTTPGRSSRTSTSSSRTSPTCPSRGTLGWAPSSSRPGGRGRPPSEPPSAASSPRARVRRDPARQDQPGHHHQRVHAQLLQAADSRADGEHGPARRGGGLQQSYQL
ncbi:hypothetical protein V2G26_017857 [Clonostachys chloroleuca]